MQGEHVHLLQVLDDLTQRPLRAPDGVRFEADRRVFHVGHTPLVFGLGVGEEVRLHTAGSAGAASGWHGVHVNADEHVAIGRAVARPVLQVDELTTPLKITAMELLKNGREFLVRVRTSGGDEGLAVPNSMRALAIMYCEEQYRAWGSLLQSVRTGQPAFERMFGIDVFEYFRQNPQAGAIFNEAMTNWTTPVGAAVPEAGVIVAVNATELP